MNWTNEVPTKPGLYWFRKKPGKKNNEIVRVFKTRKSAGTLYAHTPAIRLSYRVDDCALWYPKAEWSSTPIPQPKEAQ